MPNVTISRGIITTILITNAVTTLVLGAPTDNYLWILPMTDAIETLPRRIHNTGVSINVLAKVL